MAAMKGESSEVKMSRDGHDKMQFTGVRRSGPGRKPRACIECNKQKMKCEVMPGDHKCRHCLRKNISCVFKKTVVPVVVEKTAQTYEHKIDTMMHEIHQLRTCLNSLVEQGAAIQMHRPGLPSMASGHSLSASTPSAVAATSSYAHAAGLSPGDESTSPAMTHSSLGAAAAAAAGGQGVGGSSGGVRGQDASNMRMDMTRENSVDPDEDAVADADDTYGDHDSVHGAVTVEEPMGSLYEVTRLRNIRNNIERDTRMHHHHLQQMQRCDARSEVRDFISRGVISLAEAEDLYRSFHTSLNHYLWVGLEQIHPSFESVRQSSELLTATILTVTALHTPTSAGTFDKCYQEFLTLISGSMFSRYHSIDDVRALCIAAFWLSEVSWKLSGHAIRIATELNIHQSFSRALAGDEEHFLRARLWYMLYVCDHHFSIAYGRPPMVAESQQIREHELFLQSPHANALDRRILSQVALMQILTRIYDRFVDINGGGGGGIVSVNDNMAATPASGRSATATAAAAAAAPRSQGAMLSEADLGSLWDFNIEIDNWRTLWTARQENNAYIGTFPPKGIILYSFFAKLQLNSLAIRGVQGGSRLSPERQEFANTAVSAAASILTFVLEEADMRRALVGTPLYVHTMIAFASVFLMKVATKWSRVIVGLAVEPAYVSRLLGRMIVLLKSAVTSDRHLLYHIASGLEKMLRKVGLANVAVGSTAENAAAVMDNNKPGMGVMQSTLAMPPGNMGMGGMSAPLSGRHAPGDRVQIDGMSLDGTGGGPVVGYDGVAYGNAGAVADPGLLPVMMDGGQGMAWDRFATGGGGTTHFLDDLDVMNDSLIFEAFGSDSANDVYNLLTSQFSY